MGLHVILCVGEQLAGIVFFVFVLFCFLFCFVLFCFVLFCFVLFCFVLICFVLVWFGLGYVRENSVKITFTHKFVQRGSPARLKQSYLLNSMLLLVCEGRGDGERMERGWRGDGEGMEMVGEGRDER